MMATNQGWNHAGNIAAALLTLVAVKALGTSSIFYVMAALSSTAAASLLILRKSELNPDLAHEKGERPSSGQGEATTSWRDFLELLRDPTVRLFLVCITLFHVANAPVMPLVGLYLKKLAQTAVALGAVLGPLSQGLFTDKLGFRPTFLALAVVAAAGAVLFIARMPETRVAT